MEKAKILIVEDEAVLAFCIESSLKEMGFLADEAVPSGEEAIIKIENERPDLVLMDIMLKGKMDGIDTAGEIRSKFNVPVIYLTAYADKSILERAKLTEPFGYLVKPFKDRELKSVIEIALYKFKMEPQLNERDQWFYSTLK